MNTTGFFSPAERLTALADVFEFLLKRRQARLAQQTNLNQKEKEEENGQEK